MRKHECSRCELMGFATPKCSQFFAVKKLLSRSLKWLYHLEKRVAPKISFLNSLAIQSPSENGTFKYYAFRPDTRNHQECHDILEAWISELNLHIPPLSPGRCTPKHTQQGQMSFSIPSNFAPFSLGYEFVRLLDFTKGRVTNGQSSHELQQVCSMWPRNFRSPCRCGNGLGIVITWFLRRLKSFFGNSSKFSEICSKSLTFSKSWLVHYYGIQK